MLLFFISNLLFILLLVFLQLILSHQCLLFWINSHPPNYFYPIQPSLTFLHFHRLAHPSHSAPCTPTPQMTDWDFFFIPLRRSHSTPPILFPSLPSIKPMLASSRAKKCNLIKLDLQSCWQKVSWGMAGGVASCGDARVDYERSKKDLKQWACRAKVCCDSKREALMELYIPAVFYENIYFASSVLHW